MPYAQPQANRGDARSRAAAIWTWLLAFALALAAAPSAAQECTGDCNSNGHVEVAELVVGVGVALGTSPADRCLALGENPAIDRLVSAVDYSINGCPGGTPQPTRTATPTVMPTATATVPTPGRCGNGVVEFQPIVPEDETCDPLDGPAAEERPEQPGDTCPADCIIRDCNMNQPLEVDVRVSAPQDAFLANLTVWLRYPDGDVGIRGQGGDVLSQLTNLPPDASVTPNDIGFALRVLFLDTAEVGLPFDPLFTVRFQLCAAPPAADAFRCVVELATDYNLGNVTDQVSCSVVVHAG